MGTDVQTDELFLPENIPSDSIVRRKPDWVFRKFFLPRRLEYGKTAMPYRSRRFLFSFSETGP
jgi:hypothetical protein